MSVGAILGAIAGLGTIVGGGIWLLKRIDWQFSKSPQQTDQDIDKANQDAKHQAEDTGRPV